MQSQREKIQQLLSGSPSPLRAQLLEIGFDTLASQPLSSLTSPEALSGVILKALTRENVARVASRHVVPAVERVSSDLSVREEPLRHVLSAQAEASLRKMLQHAPAPRLQWLIGAFDADDFRQLLAPVVQQVLLQFTTKLPGFGSGGGGSGGAGIGGLVGMLGRQVQKSAGQLADVGRSVVSGLGGELERRMHAVARDFSQTATSEFRVALIERLKSDEGKRIVARMRERALSHTLSAPLGEVMQDVGRLPIEEGARFSAELLPSLAAQAWFGELLRGEIAAVLTELGARSLRDVLEEAGLLDAARAQIVDAVEPGLKALAGSDAFGAWLDRLLEESSKP